MDPPYIQALKGEWGYMKMGFFRDYHAKYMAPGKYRPVVHVIMFVMGLGYLMEYPHLKRARRRSPPTGGTRRTPLRGRHAPALPTEERQRMMDVAVRLGYAKSAVERAFREGVPSNSVDVPAAGARSAWRLQERPLLARRRVAAAGAAALWPAGAFS